MSNVCAAAGGTFRKIPPAADVSRGRKTPLAAVFSAHGPTFMAVFFGTPLALRRGLFRPASRPSVRPFAAHGPTFKSVFFGQPLLLTPPFSASFSTFAAGFFYLPPPAFLGEPPCHFASKKSAPEAPTPRPRCGCVFLQTEKQRLRMPMQRRCFDRGTDGLVPAVADKSETTRKERLFRIPPFTIRFGFSSCTSGKSRRRSEGRRLSFFGFQCFSDIPKSFSRLNRNLRFLTFCDIPSVKLSVHEKFSFFLPNCDTILF